MTRIYFGISDIDSENIGLLSKVRAGIVGSCGLGELTRGKPRRYPGSDRHPMPKGCQWARSCEDCPWDDCVVVNESELLSHDSEKAKKVRREFLDEARVRGMTVKELAVALRTSESSVKRQSITKTIVKEMRGREMALMREKGAGIVDIARRFDVHVRTVGRALASRIEKP